MKGNIIRETIPAREVEPYMFLVGLDNGYVIDVDDDHDLRGDYNLSFGRGLRLVTFHDTNGEENYLLVWPDHPVEVEYGTDGLTTRAKSHRAR